MAKQDRYAELADKIVDLLGGKKNISYFTHCVTRLRFTVKDKGLVQTEEIGKLPGAVGTQWAGDQLQVIIGQAVGDAYALICEKHGLERQDAVEEDLGDANGKKKFSASVVFDAISGSIVPLVPILIGAGFVKIVVLLLEQFGILAAGDPTHTVLTFAGDAGFYFLPVFVGATAACKLGANMALGMLMGAMFVHPTFVNAVASGESLSVYGLPIYSASYASSIIPAFLTVAVMAPVEKFFARISPDAVRSITEPFLTIMVMVPLALCVLGPLGSILGIFLCDVLMAIYNVAGPLAVGLIACLWPLMVMTGMHSAFTPITINNFATIGIDPLSTTAAIIANINQGVASLAVSIRSKNVDVKATALSCAITAAIGGVTEPALFGVNFRFKTPLYAAMIGSLVGGLIAGFGRAAAQVIIGSGGLIGGLPAYISADPANLMWMVAAVVIGAVVTFVAAYIMCKPGTLGDEVEAK